MPHSIFSDNKYKKTIALIRAKYSDVLEARKATGVTIVSEEEVLLFELLMPNYPEIVFSYINTNYRQRSHQIQWFHPYFFFKHKDIIKKLLLEGNRDVFEILRGHEKTHLIVSDFPEYQEKLKDLFEIFNENTADNTPSKRPPYFNIHNIQLYFQKPLNKIPNKLKDEILAVWLSDRIKILDSVGINNKNFSDNMTTQIMDQLFKRDIFIDFIFHSWEIRDPGFFFLMKEDAIRLETAVNFMFRYKRRLRKLSNDYTTHEDDETNGDFSNLYEYFLWFLILRSLNEMKDFRDITYKAMRPFNKINKLLIEYSSKRKLYDNSWSKNIPDFELLNKFLFLRKGISYKYLLRYSFFKPFLNHEFSKLKKGKIENISRFLDSIEMIKLNELPDKYYLILFELSIKSKHTHGIANLLSIAKQTTSNSKAKRHFSLARKIYLEEIKRGDPSAISNLHLLINNKQHTEEMLDFLIYLVESDHKNAEYFLNILKHISRENLPKTIFKYLNKKVSPKGIKETKEIEKRFHLFITLYPQFFTGDDFEYNIPNVFDKLDLNTKKQIYYLFVNRRSFRNSRNKQTDFFKLLPKIPYEIMPDFEKLIRNSSMGMLDKYLTKLMRKLVLSSKLFKKAPTINSYNNLGEFYKDYDSILSKMLTESIGDELNSKHINELQRQTELIEKVLHLSGHYKSFSSSYRQIYMEGLRSHLKGKHDGYKYNDLAILLKKYGKTTNLSPGITKRWIKTMKYVRYPQDVKQINLSVIKENLDNIKLSISQKDNRNTLNEVTKLLEQMENELYSLKSKDIEKRTLFLGKLKAVITELNKNKEFDISRIVQSIVTTIESANANKHNKFIVSDEFEFSESHDIGQKWGTCQSWTYTGKLNKGLVASINDGTKKYIAIRDSTTKEWLARGTLIFGMVGKEFAIILDNRYSSISDGEKLLFEFAKNKAEFMSRNRQKSKVNFYDAKKVMGKITLFGKEYDRGQHALKKKYKTFGKVPEYYSDTLGGLKSQEVL